MKAIFLILGLLGPNTWAIPFFKVTVDGKVNYFLGTLHRPLMAEIIPTEIFDQLKDSRVVYFEVDENKLNTQRALMDKDIIEGRLQRRNLRKIFETADWLRLKKVVEDYGIAAADFAFISTSVAYDNIFAAFEGADSELVAARSSEVLHNRSDLATRMLGNFLHLQRILAVDNEGNSPPFADFDDALHVLAKANPDIIIRYLEAEGQSLIQVDDKDFRSFVRQRLKRQREIKNASYTEIENYVERKLAQRPDEEFFLLWKPGLPLFNETIEPWTPSSHPQLLEALRLRHLKWWHKIWPALQEGGAFVAVGAAHIVGGEPDSLISLAQANGATVEFINLSCEDLLTRNSG